MSFSDEEVVRKMARIMSDEFEKIQNERAMKLQSVPSPKFMVAEMPRDIELANQHTSWFLRVIDSIYYAAFLHGYKHGVEDSKHKERRRRKNELYNERTCHSKAC